MNLIAIILLTLVFPPLASFSAPHIKTFVSKIGNLGPLEELNKQEDNSDKVDNESEESSNNILTQENNDENAGKSEEGSQEEIDKQRQEAENNSIQEEVIIDESEEEENDEKEEEDDEKGKDSDKDDNEEDKDDTGDKEEKIVSCLTYTDTVVKVSDEECELIKQKNKRSKEIDAEYSTCVDELNEGLNNCIQEAEDRTISAKMLSSTVAWCEDLWDVSEGAQECRKIRDNQMKKLWQWK